MSGYKKLLGSAPVDDGWIGGGVLGLIDSMMECISSCLRLEPGGFFKSPYFLPSEFPCMRSRWESEKKDLVAHGQQTVHGLFVILHIG